jgi:hypothetical protein
MVQEFTIYDYNSHDAYFVFINAIKDGAKYSEMACGVKKVCGNSTKK